MPQTSKKKPKSEELSQKAAARTAHLKRVSASLPVDPMTKNVPFGIAWRLNGGR